jgi:hypothetical protein
MIFKKRISVSCPKCKKELQYKYVWKWDKQNDRFEWCIPCLWKVDTRIEGKTGRAIGGFPGNSYYVDSYEEAITNKKG